MGTIESKPWRKAPKKAREDANIPHLVPPVVHCVRHAQGYHNLSLANHAIRDPALTSYGEQQCRHLARTFPYHKTVDLLVASPLKRTLDTCLISFEPEVRAGMRIIALPEAQETGPVPCDTGLDPLPLKAAYKDMSVDFELVQDGWNSKTGKWSAESADIKARALEVRQWLKARPEKEIVLVTHGGFLHYLTEDWAGFNDWAGTAWVNTELRSYEFKDEAGDNASIQETSASKQLRAGFKKPLTPTQLAELELTSERKKTGGYHLRSKVRGPQGSSTS